MDISLYFIIARAARGCLGSKIGRHPPSAIRHPPTLLLDPEPARLAKICSRDEFALELFKCAEHMEGELRSGLLVSIASRGQRLSSSGTALGFVTDLKSTNNIANSVLRNP